MGKLWIGIFLAFAAALIATLLYFRDGLVSREIDGASPEKVFSQVCAQCHGLRGEGRGDIGPPLRGKNLSIAQIKNLIQNGGNRMPPQPWIKDALLDALARHVAGL
ncbi:MAG: cytochrome c [bacterium]|nr:cytochrome c [bacterium]